MSKEKIIKSLIALSDFSNILLEISSKYNNIALNNFLLYNDTVLFKILVLIYTPKAVNIILNDW